MVKNKPRLYVVCFFRTPQEGGNPDPYHWGLASGPKDGGMEGMVLYHVRNIPTSQGVHWQFEEPPRDLSSGPTPAMLTFTAVAKIENLRRLEEVVRAVPIETSAVWTVFNCQMWVEQALAAIVGDQRCVGTNAIPANWAVLHQQCTSFSEPFREMRRQGQLLPTPRPMQNLLPS
ncbi:uncharacterized protein FTJAE_13270 [Fusarium tjaetaba]|uniref:Uncharacterized protein n=2 Tax=Fusarium fujikuroi species complex TaxID=171627 RepID=A0A8H5QGV0_9HYPO|nr:uncharacterized protein FTJAE_13270 [Fusarium tjaetaba]KAF5600053.1 hypothetical protein FPANT_2798 [Fusarium pseudoanthophilum]KAF5615671.1 hypothetical protein FTJAE_13270 [Fusarium tjaetaba]